MTKTASCHTSTGRGHLRGCCSLTSHAPADANAGYDTDLPSEYFYAVTLQSYDGGRMPMSSRRSPYLVGILQEGQRWPAAGSVGGSVAQPRFILQFFRKVRRETVCSRARKGAHIGLCECKGS